MTDKPSVLRVAGEPVATVAGGGVHWIQPQAQRLKDDTKLYTEAQLLAMYAAGAQDMRERAAKVCDGRAMKNEEAANFANDAGEHDEVTSLRSAAWQMSVCGAAIRALPITPATGEQASLRERLDKWPLEAALTTPRKA